VAFAAYRHFVTFLPAEGMKGARINFPREVRTPEETRKVLVEFFRRCSTGKS
jgi:hypothetical protein